MHGGDKVLNLFLLCVIDAFYIFRNVLYFLSSYKQSLNVLVCNEICFPDLYFCIYDVVHTVTKLLLLNLSCCVNYNAFDHRTNSKHFQSESGKEFIPC